MPIPDGMVTANQWLSGWTVILGTMYDLNIHFPLDPGEAIIVLT